VVLPWLREKATQQLLLVKLLLIFQELSKEHGEDSREPYRREYPRACGLVVVDVADVQDVDLVEADVQEEAAEDLVVEDVQDVDLVEDVVQDVQDVDLAEDVEADVEADVLVRERKMRKKSKQFTKLLMSQFL
jgi:hypothetical protein